MIRLTDIRKRFGELEVLKGVSLGVRQGEVVSVVGASGAGKTTLLQIMGTLSRPDAGRVEIGGEDPFALGDKALSRFRNDRIGLLQFHHRRRVLGLRECPHSGLIGWRPPRRGFRAPPRAAALVGLTARRDHKPGQLSGGEQQRVAIARAIVNAPAVLLADDEPLPGNLDTRNREEIHRLFFDLRDELGQTVVIVTHDERLAAMADRKITMSDGRII